MMINVDLASYQNDDVYDGRLLHDTKTFHQLGLSIIGNQESILYTFLSLILWRISTRAMDISHKSIHIISTTTHQ